MKTLTLFCVINLLLACATPRMATMSYKDWDSNGDAIVDRSEFLNAYAHANYFEKWSSGSSATYAELFEGIFKTLDTNKDLKIDQREFESRVKPFYFNMFHGSFSGWDNDGSNNIDKQEFMKHVSSTDLAVLWDTSGDKYITDSELASGMFYLCDANKDHQIDEIEFNIWKVNR